MKASNTRRPLHQQQAPEQKGPFFNHAHDDAQKKDDVFFQTKLAVGEKDDKHEKEADTVADKVQKKTEEKEKPEVQKKTEEQEKPDVQKKGKEEEPDKDAAVSSAVPAKNAAAAVPAHNDKGKDAASPAANPAHKELGKAALPQPAQERGEPGKEPRQQSQQQPDKHSAPHQAAGNQKEPDKNTAPAMSGGKEDKDLATVQKMDKKEEDQPVQKKGREEEKPIQKMSSGDKKEEDKTRVSKKEEGGTQEKEEPATVQKKESGGTHAAHKVSLEERIRASKGKGQMLPDDVRSFLEAELGADFSEVVIHTDGEAIAMNKELKALAFTNGFDIYFNEGQYKPDTRAGQKLLAHELTHVIQQTGVSKKKQK